jgi:3-oxoacyl-[acyl-carrier-protein] synthase-3
MQRTSNIGILGIGTYLPPEVRKNDWWPESTVAQWMEKRIAGRAKHVGDAPMNAPGAARVLAAVAKTENDPFQGAVERRVMPDDMLASDMELRAANEAIARAGVALDEIDVLLCYSSVPDFLVTNNACILHKKLGLPQRCFTMAMDAACNSFMMQLSLAEQLLAGGKGRKALLVQSSSISRFLDPKEPGSPWFGDGATAVVVGPVSEGRGVLSSVHVTDGTFSHQLVAGIRDRHWYDDGRVVLYSADPRRARQMFLEVADRGREVVNSALDEAGCRADEVDFFGVHQGTPWLREVTREHFGLVKARSVETFKWAASLFASNIPLGLAIGQREGLLKSDDLVLMFAGGAGITYSSVLMRWGD